MNKITFGELESKMRKFNEENNITSKGVGAELKAVIVFTEDSFKEHYPLESRSYEVTNHNKAWIPNMSSNSIFGSSLDGTDNDVRLDWYIHENYAWRVDYCYIVEN